MDKPQETIIKPNDIDAKMVQEINQVIPGFEQIFTPESLNNFNKDQHLIISGVSNGAWCAFMLGISHTYGHVNIGIEISPSVKKGEIRESASFVQFSNSTIQGAIKMWHDHTQMGNIL